MEFCEGQQSNFQHQCVLDQYCFMERNSSAVSTMRYSEWQHSPLEIHVGLLCSCLPPLLHRRADSTAWRTTWQLSRRWCGSGRSSSSSSRSSLQTCELRHGIYERKLDFWRWYLSTLPFQHLRDVVLLRNPLPWLAATFGSGDMAFSSEQCADWAAFKGDSLRCVGKVTNLTGQGADWAAFKGDSLRCVGHQLEL